MVRCCVAYEEWFIIKKDIFGILFSDKLFYRLERKGKYALSLSFFIPISINMNETLNGHLINNATN